MSIKIYCINLKRSKKRREFMERQFQQLGMEAEFIAAIDARELTEEQLEQCSDLNAVRNATHWLSPGVIACALSHRICYKKMMDSNLPSALILEDDVVLAGNIKEILKRMNEQLKKEEVLMLYYQSFKIVTFSRSGVKKLDAKHDLLYPVDSVFLGASGAYLISIDAARNIYNNGFPIDLSADSWGHFIRRGWIKSVRISIPFAAQSSLEESATDYIDPKILKGRLKSLISRKQIFPFYQLLRWKRKQNWNNTTRYIFSDAPLPLERK